MSGSSGIEHLEQQHCDQNIFTLLSKSIFAGGEKGYALVFACYLDDSDNSCGPIITIGGYYTTISMWEKFEPIADQLLKSYGVEILRGKDFRNGHGSFKGWSRNKKSKFVNDLYFVAKDFIIEGVCSSANKKDWLKVKASYSGYQNMSPLGICFASTVTSILVKSPVWQNIFASKMSFIVEDGNKNNGNLVNYFKYLKKSDEKIDKTLGSITFIDKKSCRAVQIADFLAFHGRLLSERWEKEGYTLEFGGKNEIEDAMMRHVHHRFNRTYGTTVGEGRVGDDGTENLNFIFSHDRRFGKGTG